MEELVSVVVPVYNVENYLETCLESVAGQSYRNLEILLINDGSTDHSGEVCREWLQKDSRIIYVDKRNEGSGPTRNLGIRMASGKYITFIDSDDWWDPHYIEQMMAFSGKGQIVVCDLYYVDYDAGGQLQPKVSGIRMSAGRPESPREDPDLINRARVFLCGKIFDKDLFTENGIWQPNLAINDFPIVPLLVAKADQICRVGKPFYYYLRGRQGNTVTSFDALWSFLPALELLHDNFVRAGLEEKYRSALHKLYFSQVRFAIRKGIQAVREGAAQEEFLRLKERLFEFMDRVWPEWPRIDGKVFRVAGRSELGEAVKLVLFEDNRYQNGCGACDYLIFDESASSDVQKSYEADKMIPIQASHMTCPSGGRAPTGCAGPGMDTDAQADQERETLLWNLADQILFAISSS